jgi:transcriptional regulator with XRE-family HTH domain
MSTVKNPRPNVAKNLALNLKRLLEVSGLGVRELSRRSGISHGAISNYLNEEAGSDPSASTLLMLCKEFGCTIEEILSEPVTAVKRRAKVSA